MDMQQSMIVDKSHLAISNEAAGAGGPRATARLIEYASNSYFVLPPHTTLEIIDHPAIVAVPGAAYYAYGLMKWQDQYIPMIDIDTLLRAHPDMPEITAPRYALVVAYQRAPGAPIEHGALGLTALPQTIEVGDEAWCDLPTNSDLWPLLSLSCVQYHGAIVPILDTAKLFMRQHG